MVEGRQRVIPCPFVTSPEATVMMDGTGAVLAERTPASGPEEADIRIIKFGSSGDTIWVSRVRYVPTAVSDSLLSRAVNDLRARMSTGGTRAPSSADLRSALSEIDCVPAFLPPVTALVSAQDGTIWMRGSDAENDSVDWYILESDGAQVGHMRLPSSELVAAARGDALVTVWPGELDVPYLTVYRLHR